MKAELLFLGTGGSLGVPVIGCKCSVCKSNDPKNIRTRPSALATVNGKRLLIDAGTDLREQALKFGIEDIDGVMLTHAHHDHTAGIDELRAFSFLKGAPIPCLMSEATFSEMRMRYHYIFGEEKQREKITSSAFLLQLLKEECEFVGEKIGYVTFEQGGMKVNGFLMGNLAYISDIKDYDDSLFDELNGVEVLVVSAAREKPSNLHLTVGEAIDFSKRVGAKRTYLTHLSHELDYEKISNALPSNVEMAYDGLLVPFEV